MPKRGRFAHELIIIAGLLLGSCMESPERTSPRQLAAMANDNALKALGRARRWRYACAAWSSNLKPAPLLKNP